MKNNENKDASRQDENEDHDPFFDTEEGPADETIKDNLLKKTVAAKKAGMLYDPEDRSIYYNTVAEATDEAGKNDLMRAAENGNYTTVKDLIRKGYALTSQDKDGNTALMLACKNNHFDAARVIIEAIEAKIDRNTSTEQYTKNLRKQSEYLQIVNKKGENALSLAVMPNFVSAIYTLLEDKGAVLSTHAGKALDTTIKLAQKKLEGEIESQKDLLSNTTSKSALTLANSEITALQEKLNVAKQMKEENINIVQVSDVDLKIAKEAVNINFQDKNGKTALIRAIESGDNTHFEKLMEFGPNLDLQDNEGNTAAMKAASTKNRKAIECLNDKGANLALQNKDGKTALMLAFEAKDLALFGALLYFVGINVEKHLNMQDKDGETLLMKAVKKEYVEILEEYASKDKDNNTLSENVNVKLVKQLKEYGSDLTLQDKDGNTALMLACANNNLEMVKALSERQKPEYFNMRNKEGHSAYSMTTDNQIREILRANGVHITLADRMGEALQRETTKSPIEIAIEKSDAEYIKNHIKTVLDFRNKDGDTALILASRANNFKIVKEIIDGIPKPEDKIKYINISNNKGENALSIHNFSADVDDKIAQYLQEQGNSELLGFNYVKQQQHKKDAPKQEFTSRLSAVEKGYKTDLGKIKDQLQKKQFKNELKAEQKKLGKQIFQDRLNTIFGGEVSDNTRDELREMQKMLGRVKRSDQFNGVIDRVINKFSNKKGRTQ